MACKQKSVRTLHEYKSAGQKITCLTAYDAAFAQAISGAGVDCMLVGDTLGMVLQGRDDTLGVTVQDMAYHTRCVRAGNRGAVIVADMPFMSYATPEQAMDNAALLMQSGAHCVKLEGGGEWVQDIVAHLDERGIPVCAHLGLVPQSVHKIGGYRVQGRDAEQAEEIMQSAHALQNAGAALLVLECIPPQLAGQITQDLYIPTIGIGAGADTDGQVLVLHDMLGLNPSPARFVRNFMEGADSIEAALQAYVRAVRDGSFPAQQHSYA